MNYELQRAFLASQRRLAFRFALPGVVLLALAPWIPLPWLTPPSLAFRIISTFMSLALSFIILSDLPTYLALDANPRRRFRWIENARPPLYLLLLLFVLPFTDKFFYAPAIPLLWHFAIRRRLRTVLPIDPTAASHVRLTTSALIYFALDFSLFVLLTRSTPGVLLIPLFALSVFFSAVLFRFQTLSSAIWFSLAAAAASLAIHLNPISAAGIFLFTAATTWLLARADKQNVANFESLVEDLQMFHPQPRREIVHLLATANDNLIADWHSAHPKGPAELSAWYSRNARNYLFANTQHHLLYRHITYTLGLLHLARGRVLDFGGGPGTFSLALARRGFDVTYLDVPGESAEYLRWQAERHNLRVNIVHDFAALRGPFDTLFALDVLEHIEDVRATLDAWSSLLPPGGRLIATYYNGPVSSAPMHLDPGFDAKQHLLAHGFFDVKPHFVSWHSPALLRKSHFMILEKKNAPPSP